MINKTNELKKLSKIPKNTQKIKVPLESNSHHQMTVFELSRWIALMRGINTIEQHAYRSKINLSKDNRWIAPIALQHFMDDITASQIMETLQSEGLN